MRPIAILLAFAAGLGVGHFTTKKAAPSNGIAIVQSGKGGSSNVVAGGNVDISSGTLESSTSGKYDLGSASHHWSPPIGPNNIVDMKEIKTSIEAIELFATFRSLYIDKPKGKKCSELMAPWRGLMVYGKDSGETGCVFEF